MDGFEGWFTVLAAVVTVGLGSVLYVSHRGRRRWGKVVSSTEVGEGAYRAVQVQSEQDRGTPAAVNVAAIASVTWAAITLLVFVPAGTLLAGLGLDQSRWAPLGLFSLAVTLSGLVLSIMLAIHAFRLVRRRSDVAQHSLTIARFSYIHHALVWFGFSVAVLLTDASHTLSAAFALALPCGIGLLVGALVGQAGAAGLEIERLEVQRLETAPLT